MKLPLFHGNGTDDLEQYWFLCEAMWTVRQVTYDDVKKGQLATTLSGRALDWFINFIQVPHGNSTKTLDEIQMGLIKEFKKLKLKAQ